MTVENLKPKLNFLSEEYVLAQAWKKTASYIRSHNWYADTLALDRAAANLPDFIRQLSNQLRSPEDWRNDPLRIVPAPKSQAWYVEPKSGKWRPQSEAETAKKLRPLAHVSLRDQVTATALMLCLADRVETLQGDPRVSISDPSLRRTVVSYGNRLYCEDVSGELVHPWGSGKLYRAYFEDYRRFLSRTEKVAEEVSAGSRAVIIHSDLRQFYDRVRPELLAGRIESLRRSTDDPRFFEFVRRFLSWKWHAEDQVDAEEYARDSEIADFATVALPQGLVAAGFFANIVLLDFDRELSRRIGKEVIRGVRLHDACRYVDDIRLVLSSKKRPHVEEIKQDVFKWLQELSNSYAGGLPLSPEKTEAALFRGDERPLVRQGRRMERIQRAISGGFDVVGGEEILDALQSLVRAQSRYAAERTIDQGWSLAPVPDVRDDTVARFTAARFRTTFRSLRPLLDDPEEAEGAGHERESEEPASLFRAPRTRADLDDEARAFALGLIENWVEDPSNVRLLRIGLDLWPSEDVLERILSILGQYTTASRRSRASRRVAAYCLAEVFRAGATETGFVENKECLPNGVDIGEYRNILAKEAERLASLAPSALPWYLKQQVLLFLATMNQGVGPTLGTRASPETKHYSELIRYLRGDDQRLTDRDFATLAILSRRAFVDRQRAIKLARAGITGNRASLIVERDPTFGLEILQSNKEVAQAVPPRVRRDLCLTPIARRKGWQSLATIVLGGAEFLRTEPTLLEFAARCLERWPPGGLVEVVTPSDVWLRIDGSPPEKPKLAEAEILPGKTSSKGYLYRPPEWCPLKDRWRLQLGYLLRFVLTAQPDFTRIVHLGGPKKENVIYRVPESHWYQRRYGLYSGRSAFGADWLPITDWVEELLFALLRWPGCRRSRFSDWVDSGIQSTLRQVRKRLIYLSGLHGKLADVSILPITSKWPERPKSNRPLRVCVVQTVIPEAKDIISDPSVSEPGLRKKHRKHLSAALAAVERMLDLRETHKGSDARLDLLVFPELSVHPSDVDSHLVPFARVHESIILAGLTYEELFPGQPFVNSALWLIPVWSQESGMDVLRVRQGKLYLAHEEEKMNTPTTKLMGFRPCQWLVGYQWNPESDKRPLRLTASVCYDATDIRLAADLSDKSDVFVVPSLNQDVSTFDHMALSLHYHMFQMVIVANNGAFGGSNAYAPYRERYHGQVFHLHGQPQASIAFLEIDDIGKFLRRPNSAIRAGWKYPPAGRKRS
jgi:hypothetical protein